MAPSSVLRAAACAGAALGASAVALSREALPGAPASSGAAAELLARQDVSRPMPADLERWAHGPIFAANSTLYHATVESNMGNYNLTIAAFDRYSDEGVSGGLLAGTGWEKNHIAELCKEFQMYGSVGNFLDIGANIGTFTIPLADCLKFSGGKVVAVEGMPLIADHLAVGILANNLQNVDMYNYAVGAPDDPKMVTMSLNPVNKGGSTVKGNKPFTEMSDDQLQDLFHPGKAYAPKVVVLEFDVPLTTGDKILENNPAMKAISFAKVDIEGHEGHFLRGAQRFFSEYAPCVMTIELIPEWLERAGTPVEEILDSLKGWGYKAVLRQLGKLRSCPCPPPCGDPSALGPPLQEECRCMMGFAQGGKEHKLAPPAVSGRQGRPHRRPAEESKRPGHDGLWSSR
ncbi:unnamed protein product [Prorocentrum cordatum]|uniref:Methyltransferase FkbM domain-containing protein n=1 Tax=Prorocentrum cordatum TaxID=2364126 RepID=A0ABN9U4D7_9DINO|nr:unnamed protein product [Polarella glacialis]